MDALTRVVEEVRARRGLDPRTTVFDVRVESGPDGCVLVGEATDGAAVEDLIARAATFGTVTDRIVRLPAHRSPAEGYALVRSAVAPLLPEPRISAAPTSQYVLGQRLEVLDRRGPWLRVRGDDGYIGWLHTGYALLCGEKQAHAWEQGAGGEPVISLGLELRGDDGARLCWLPWGARLVREADGRLRLPDGRAGLAGAGEVVEVERLPARFPPDGDSVVRTARRWAGTPYLWAGVTPAGADCSGFVQAVFRLHGIALPRDSDMQARMGEPVDPGADFAALRPGDLLFFAENGERITHVALSLGGSRIIHSALAAGGVAEYDLNGSDEREVRLRECYRCARRVLPA